MDTATALLRAVHLDHRGGTLLKRVDIARVIAQTRPVVVTLWLLLGVADLGIATPV